MNSALKPPEQAASTVTHPTSNAAAVDASGSSTSTTGSDQLSRSDDTRPSTRLGSKIAPPRGTGRRLKNLTMLSRQLAVLVRTGTPIVQSLEAIRRQVKPGPWRNVLDDLGHRIEEGSQLSAAMQQHPLCFNSVCWSLVAAGEASGELEAMLERLADLSRQQLRMRRSISGALIYPALLATVGVVVVIVMIGFVLPRFTGLFETLDAPLPPTTEMLMTMSEILKSQWWLVLIGSAITVAAGKFALSTSVGQRTADMWIVRIPILGTFVRNLITARIARLLGVLLGSQVRLLEALQLTRQAITNSAYSELMLIAEDGVSTGEPLSESFENNFLINPSLTEAIRHGEQNGQLGVVLKDMADFMDEENEVVVRTLASIIEPIILIVLGAIVAVIAISMFMPLFDLTSLAGAG